MLIRKNPLLNGLLHSRVQNLSIRMLQKFLKQENRFIKTLVRYATPQGPQGPARAGNPDLQDTELGRAVVYMANNAGAQFKEPSVPPPSNPAVTSSTPAPPSSPVTPVVAVPAALASSAATGNNSNADAGKKLYDTACVSCHASGVANAPKLGDKAAWAARLALGTEQLTKSVITGKGAMPPKGGSNASEEEIKAAVLYMTAAAK